MLCRKDSGITTEDCLVLLQIVFIANSLTVYTVHSSVVFPVVERFIIVYEEVIVI